MKCGGCETNIKEKLGSRDGILSMKASHKDDTVEVEFDGDQISLEDIKKAIMEAGFTVEE